VGAVLSIRVTVAVVFQVLPAVSLNSKVNVQSPVNIYQVDQPLFVIVHASSKLMVATTLPLVMVHEVGEYVMVHIGAVVSGGVASGMPKTYRLACVVVKVT
jgi:hydrogenase maturation factor